MIKKFAKESLINGVGNFYHVLLFVFLLCFGLSADDSYSWLEETTSEKTRDWLNIQEKKADRFLGENSKRTDVLNQISEICNYEYRSVPREIDGKFIYLRRLPHEEQSSLCLEYEGTINKIFSPETHSHIDEYSVSSNNRFIAIGFSSNGSDWQCWKIYDLLKAKFLPEELKGIKFGNPVWVEGCVGFFYHRFHFPALGKEFLDQTTEYELFFHRLETPQSSDLYISSYQAHPHMLPNTLDMINHDREILISLQEGKQSGIYRVKVYENNDQMQEVLYSDEFSYQYSGKDIDDCYFVTNENAPKRKVIKYNVQTKAVTNLICEDSNLTLQHAEVIGDKVVAVYIKDAINVVKIFNLQGNFLYDVNLSKQGTLSSVRGDLKVEPSYNKNAFYFGFTNFVTPLEIYSFDLKTEELKKTYAPDYSWDPSDFETVQQFYVSQDGTPIPIFIVSKKMAGKSGPRPTILYGYGGFNISVTPFFDPFHLAWLQSGGTLALANIRGGGEYGDKWHEAAMVLKKQTSFDDFICAAEWLVHHGYTSEKKLAISGRSNGGLLIGACLTQRPDLFRSAICGVGVLDMLRFHLYTVGQYWVAEYGSADNAYEKANLLSYSPYHNITRGVDYPAVLVTTGDHDDRVVPIHSYKFTAALQEATASQHPIILRVYKNCGHMVGYKPKSEQFNELTDNLLFLKETLEWKF